MLISGCLLDGEPAIVLRGTAAFCPVCGECVYPDLLVLRNHNLHNWGHSARWFSRDLGLVVHGCGAEGAGVVEVETSELRSVG